MHFCVNVTPQKEVEPPKVVSVKLLVAPKVAPVKSATPPNSEFEKLVLFIKVVPKNCASRLKVAYSKVFPSAKLTHVKSTKR